MAATELQGRNAASHKYDLITAMGTMALASPPGQERLIFRLITLVTARYNWAKDDLSVGQREIARLWSVTERTVKREMAKLRTLGWLEVRHQGARGRVTSYRLRSEKILLSSQPHWQSVGPDFVARMAPARSPAPSSVVTVDFKAASRVPEEGAWRDICLALQRDAPDHYASWYQRLSFEACENGQLHLIAPNPFIANYVEAHLMAPLLRASSERLGPLRHIIMATSSPKAD